MKQNKNILVTGGTGMVGKHLKEILPNARYIGSEVDLRDITATLNFFRSLPESNNLHVIHLAAKVGGIQDNVAMPAEFYDDNILMNTNLLRVCKAFKVNRFTAILSTCAYPDKVEKYPMTEDDLFSGPPAKTNFGYGFSKRGMAVQIDAYNQQYDTKYNYLIPSNIYSELDNYENDTKLHFIQALLKKLKNLKTEILPITQEEFGELQLLGTGKPLRQFMYTGDLARVIKEVIDKDIIESFNVAPDYNYSIDEMARMAIEVVNKKCEIVYDKPELDGQYRKDVSNKKMMKFLPNFKFTELKHGMEKTYDKIS